MFLFHLMVDKSQKVFVGAYGRHSFWTRVVKLLKVAAFSHLVLKSNNFEKIKCNVQPSQATETPSVEKHAHPPRVVYCAIYLTLTLITKFRVSNLHIATR